MTRRHGLIVVAALTVVPAEVAQRLRQPVGIGGRIAFNESPANPDRRHGGI